MQVLRLALGNTPSEEIPHLGPWVLQILLHSERRLASLVLARLHCPELGERFLYGPRAVLASESWATGRAIL